MFAVLAYALPLLGGLLGLAIDRGNSLTRVHATQSIGALLTMALSLLVWAVAGYLLALVPVIGPIFSISLFSLVIAMAIFLAVNWVISLYFALRGEERTIPLADRVTTRLFGEAGA
ncbi:MAG: hypothetical protein OXG92_15215 [Chloroflexi bacterium]|nr:hypothetical protein [Chloroflexota bacterium]MCY3583730.1 hypothetical protein [Chloroflexota bacterium]MCY3717798.1 hypothetical protein [Chloroflexota bacterium]MDE2650243.1 hypothetical protein [Chloroflexota bacterium]MXV93363.1 hypothetical protein [Chloroflexota bacterium]